MTSRASKSAMRGKAAALTALAALFTAAPARAADPITVTARAIAQLDKSDGHSRFGDFLFVGGFEFSSTDPRLAGVSALRLSEDGTRFLAITDLGSWFAGRIGRDGLERPTGILDAQIAPLKGLDGQPIGGKYDADAESLSIEKDRVLVGFERDHRIWAYADASSPFESPATDVPLPLPRNELRSNQGIETIAKSPASGPLAGASVAVSEKSLDKAGNIFAAVFDAATRSKNGVFKVRSYGDWDVSDGSFLPNGDLLLLERKYTGLFGGLGIRIRRVAGKSIGPGALVDGKVILDLDLGQEIDNMEGIDVWTDKEGRTRITMVADDNASFFQRQLLLEFVLDPKKPKKR